LFNMNVILTVQVEKGVAVSKILHLKRFTVLKSILFALLLVLLVSPPAESLCFGSRMSLSETSLDFFNFEIPIPFTRQRFVDDLRASIREFNKAIDKVLSGDSETLFILASGFVAFAFVLLLLKRIQKNIALQTQKRKEEARYARAERKRQERLIKRKVL